MSEVLSTFEPASAAAPRLLAVGEVDVWRVPLDPPAGAVADLRRLLSPDERARLARFRLPLHRRRFTVARGVLRRVLGGYLRRPPAALRFAYGERDKPRLAGPLEFNLSHSSELALLAVTVGCGVGIDLEAMRPLADAPALAERYFSVAERSALAAYRDDDRERAFFRCWTRKEAYVKAVGDGIPLRLDRFDVSLDTGSRARLLALADEPAGAAAWSLIHIEPGPGYVGALALRARSVTVRGWQWLPAAGHGLTTPAGSGRRSPRT